MSWATHMLFFPNANWPSHRPNHRFPKAWLASLHLCTRCHFSQTTQKMRWYFVPSLQSTPSFLYLNIYIYIKSCVWMHVSVGLCASKCRSLGVQKGTSDTCWSYRQLWDVSHGYWKKDSSRTVRILVGWAGQREHWLPEQGRWTDWLSRAERTLIGWVTYLLAHTSWNVVVSLISLFLSYKHRQPFVKP